jgi:DNA-binding MarR family transcriptional regulator
LILCIEEVIGLIFQVVFRSLFRTTIGVLATKKVPTVKNSYHILKRVVWYLLSIWVVKLVGDLPLLYGDTGDIPLDILLDQVLTPTDAKIIEVVASLKRESGKTPTASDIQVELAKSSKLKKTQLYERLNRLSRLGFLSVRQLPRPRRYIVNKNTITQGVESWIGEQRTSIASLSSELKLLYNYLEQLNTKSFVSAIAERLSMDFGSG